MEDSGWSFDKINSMTIFFYKTSELNGSSYVKIPIRSSPILNIKNFDKYCFISLILALLHPCENSHANRVSIYLQYFKELNIDGFDFSNGRKCSDFHRFEKLHNLSMTIFELIIFIKMEMDGNIK